jgi:site-specific DNA recombinase
LFGDGFSTVSAHSLAGTPVARAGKSSRKRRSRGPDADARPVSYARYSSDNQDEKSIREQQQVCREAADKEGLTIAECDEFFDEAVSGAVTNRDGLDRLFHAARSGKVSRIFIWSLSRLSRESLQTQAFFKEMTDELGIRITSVTDGIDTRSEGSHLQVGFTSLFDEHYLKQLRQNVMRGQRGTIDAGYAAGDHRFGYVSVPSPDGATQKKLGLVLPRKVYAIEPNQAAIVQEIFRWFGEDGWSISAICRELNARGVTKGHRSSTSHWDRHLVIRILRSEKYVGRWPWGLLENRRDTQTGKKYQVERDPGDPLICERELPELRIVTDDVFQKAQTRLDSFQRDCAANRDARGRLCGAHAHSGRKSLFKGLLLCAECGRTLVTYSGDAKYLACPKSLVDACANRGLCRRETAQRLILAKISDAMVGHETFVDEVHQQAVAEFERLRAQPGPDRAKLDSELEDVRKKHGRLVAFIMENDVVDKRLADELKSLQAIERGLRAQLETLDRSNSVAAVPPTRDWVRDQLKRMNEILAGGGEDGATILQKVLDGRIEVSVVPYPGDKRPAWQARFRLRRSLFCTEPTSVHAEQAGSNADGEDGAWITVLLREPNLIEKLGVKLFSLLKAGRSLREISVEMQLRESRISAIVKHVEQHNADGLTAQQVRGLINANRPKRPSRVEQILDQAMELWDRGLLNCQIAQILNTNRDLITKTIRLGCERRGTPLTDGRTRRKGLAYKGRKGFPRVAEDNSTLTDVASGDGTTGEAIEPPNP